MVSSGMADGSAQRQQSLVAESYLDQRIGQQSADRPLIRTDAIIAEICEGLRAGIPLRQICRSKHLPNRNTVIRWRESDEALKKQLADARARGVDALAEECMEIADDASNDYVEREVAAGRMKRVIDTEHVQRSKLRIDTRLKLAAVWNHAEYGAKSSIDATVSISLEQLVLSSIASEPLNITPIAISNVDDAYDDLL